MLIRPLLLGNTHTVIWKPAGKLESKLAEFVEDKKCMLNFELPAIKGALEQATGNDSTVKITLHPRVGGGF